MSSVYHVNHFLDTTTTNFAATRTTATFHLGTNKAKVDVVIPTHEADPWARRAVWLLGYKLFVYRLCVQHDFRLSCSWIPSAVHFSARVLDPKDEPTITLSIGGNAANVWFLHCAHRNSKQVTLARVSNILKEKAQHPLHSFVRSGRVGSLALVRSNKQKNEPRKDKRKARRKKRAKIIPEPEARKQVMAIEFRASDRQQTCKTICRTRSKKMRSRSREWSSWCAS